MGKRLLYSKVWAFSIAGCLAGLAGGMYATYISYIGPDDFSNNVNILVIAMVIVGGAGTIFGPLVGAILLSALPPVLSLLPLPPTVIGPLEQIIYGALLVVFVLSRADGLYGLSQVGWSRIKSIPWAPKRPALLREKDTSV